MQADPVRVGGDLTVRKGDSGTGSGDLPRAAIVDALIARHGRTFAAEAGIPLARNTPSPLFRLLCLSLLIGARIRAEVAVAAARSITQEGWTTARKLADSAWEHRVRALNRAGYARYDESTARYLEGTARHVLDAYEGDLRHLRTRAAGDEATARAALEECRGIGPVGSSFFVREVQAVWTEFDPFVDDRTSRSARTLGLPGRARDLRGLVGSSADFARLVAALVRSELAGDHEEILGGTRIE